MTGNQKLILTLIVSSGPPVRRGSPRGKRVLDPSERGTLKVKPLRPPFHSRVPTGSKSPVLGQLDDPFRVTSITSSGATDNKDSVSAGSDAFTLKGKANGAHAPPTTPGKRKAARKPETQSTKSASPALTARRRTRNVLPLLSDLTKVSLGEALAALEHHAGHPDSSELSSWELEDAYVRKYIALRRAVKNAMSSGELYDATSVQVPPQSERTIYVSECTETRH